MGLVIVTLCFPGIIVKRLCLKSADSSMVNTEVVHLVRNDVISIQHPPTT